MALLFIKGRNSSVQEDEKAMLEYYVMTLGFIPYFTSRTFVPLFSAALLIQLSEYGGKLLDDPLVAILGGAPPWMTNGWMLVILGLLALFEVIAGKSPEMRELSLLVDSKTKAMAAFALSFALAPSTFQENAANTAVHAFSFVQSMEYAWAVVIGAGTWVCAAMRGTIHQFLITADPDDDLGLQGLLSWLEDGIGFVGVFFVVLLPMLSLVVLGMTVLGLWLTRTYLEKREEKSKVPCERCAVPFAPCGPHCPSCGHGRSLVRSVGKLGIVRETLATDPARHVQDLRAQKRCPNCGERLSEKRLDQSCASCRTAPFADRRELDAYLAEIRAQLPKVLIWLLAIGLVPLVGLVVGVVYYRLSILASLRCYLPRGTGILARWVVRLTNLVILCFQPVPILGMFTLPLMCLINYVVYRSLLEKQADRALHRTLPQPAYGTG